MANLQIPESELVVDVKSILSSKDFVWSEKVVSFYSTLLDPLFSQLKEGETSGNYSSPDFEVDVSYSQFKGGRNPIYALEVKTQEESFKFFLKSRVSPNELNQRNDLEKIVQHQKGLNIPNYFYFNNRFVLSSFVQGKEGIEGLDIQKTQASVDEFILNLYNGFQSANITQENRKQDQKNLYQSLVLVFMENLQKKPDDRWDISEYVDESSAPLEEHLDEEFNRLNSKNQRFYSKIKEALQVMDELYSKQDSQGNFIYRTKSHNDFRASANVLFNDSGNDLYDVSLIDFEMMGDGLVLVDRERFSQHRLVKSELTQLQEESIFQKFVDGFYARMQDLNPETNISLKEVREDMYLMSGAVRVFNEAFTYLGIKSYLSGEEKIEKESLYHTRLQDALNDFQDTYLNFRSA